MVDLVLTSVEEVNLLAGEAVVDEVFDEFAGALRMLSLWPVANFDFS